jgi:RND family efflux transporter MFP subunit
VIKAGGEIQAAQGDEVTLVATSDGVVSFVNKSIADGMAVRAGEAVVSVSARTLQDGDRNAIARINYETERKAFERAEGLVRDEIISVKEFEQIRRRYETARTAYDALSAHTTAQGVAVTTPVSGYIGNRMVGEGEYVSVGQPVATVSQNNRLQLKVDVPEKYYGLLKTVHTAHFRTAYGDTLYKIREMNGRLLSFGKATERTAGYIPVTFGFDNTDDILPGAFAEVYLLTTAVAEAIAIPVSAVTEEQGLYFVYLRVHDDAYRKQEVAIGADDGERVHIVAGLKSGDEVVTRGVYQVRLAANTGAIPEGHSHSH